MLKILSLITVSLLFNSNAFAASVDWSVGPVSINIYTKDFKITAVESTMTCRISDGSGLFTALPTTTLNTTLIEDKFFAGSGNMYLLDIEGGNVNGFQVFAKLQSCSYYIEVYSEQADGQILSGRTVLASANEDQVSDLVKDKSLNKKINSEKAFVKLELSENKAVIVEAE